jgi:ATP sulfurylase
MLAALHVDEVWQPSLRTEAETVYATTHREHPGVAHVLDSTHPYQTGET